MPMTVYMLGEHDVIREAPAKMQHYTLTPSLSLHTACPPGRRTDAHMEQPHEMPPMQTVSNSSGLSQTYRSLH